MKNKVKTHKATAKRFKLTGTGKVRRNKQRNKNNAHLRSQRKSTRKVDPENLGIEKMEAKKVKELLGK